MQPPVSVYSNRELDYRLHESVRIIGADCVRSGLGYDGNGVGVTVIDFGVDGSNRDARYPGCLVQNVKIANDAFFTGSTPPASPLSALPPPGWTSSLRGPPRGATINGLAAADTTYIPRKAWLPYYTTLSGTSMAIPHVSGTVALVEEANPALGPDGIERVITATARPMPWYRVRGGDRLPGRLRGRREGESATLVRRPARQARRARPSRRGGL